MPSNVKTKEWILKHSKQEHESVMQLIDYVSDPPVICVVNGVESVCINRVAFERLKTIALKRTPKLPMIRLRGMCCERDLDADGNCDRHPNGRKT